MTLHLINSHEAFCIKENSCIQERNEKWNVLTKTVHSCPVYVYIAPWCMMCIINCSFDMVIVICHVYFSLCCTTFFAFWISVAKFIKFTCKRYKINIFPPHLAYMLQFRRTSKVFFLTFVKLINNVWHEKRHTNLI